MNTISYIQQDLATEIAELNNTIIAHLNSKEELIGLLGNYLLEAGGKRIRPLLTLLTSRMFGYNGPNSIRLASSVEFIHAATLLHDDVVDESSMRRSRPTANIIWGNKASILVGDFLFSQSFKLMVATQSLEAMKSLSRAAAIISEGEVMQLAKLNQRRIISLIEYQEIIMAKTAELFGASCEVGAIIAGKPETISYIMRDFGRNLGNIFQIVDDLFDYLGSSNDIGKNIGDDFKEGKVTLPLIFLYEKLNKQQKKNIILLIKAPERSSEEFEFVRKLIIEYQIKQQIIDYLLNIKQQANKLLEQITIENIYKEHLLSLLEFSLHRKY